MYLNEESIIGTEIDKFNLKHNSDKHFTRTLKNYMTCVNDNSRERERKRESKECNTIFCTSNKIFLLQD